jgi:hypothetical protein
MTKTIKKAFFKHLDGVDAILNELETTDTARGLTALLALKKKISELENKESSILEVTQTDNIGNAIKRIMALRSGASVSPKIFVELLEIPEIWLKGRNPSKKSKGHPPLTVTQAFKMHRRMMPFLEETFEIIEKQPEEDRERLKDELLNEWRTLSPEEMMTKLYAFTKGYELDEEEMPIEEERIVRATDEEMESVLAFMLDPNRIYGVVPKEQILREGV